MRGLPRPRFSVPSFSCLEARVWLDLEPDSLILLLYVWGSRGSLAGMYGDKAAVTQMFLHPAPPTRCQGGAQRPGEAALHYHPLVLPGLSPAAPSLRPRTSARAQHILESATMCRGRSRGCVSTQSLALTAARGKGRFCRPVQAKDWVARSPCLRSRTTLPVCVCVPVPCT